MSEYEFDDTPDRIDVDAVWAYLSTDAYWGRKRTRADFEAQLAAAWRVVGVYHRGTGAQVGFARALSDGVGTAYLADVFVLESARGQGLGKALVRAMIEEGPGAGFRWMLHTRDAHTLYESFGFTVPNSMYMERPGGF
ncbi:GNAT family N-acetyltransferase [Actinokineospora diospyrosa]|uniref:Acetyltransferase (GNAT) family protein n=1 Tax=Actinokineospora diospyrosa TaxID=103728 RepID=A0ABT1IB14_9PSEU|nr:GNAT family N-acetyltransferase [Actinokineospora diospyrosa]MCP2269830.1 Acetyltransferase (GNAT) family protein [Actinokineospora diospyrosa]